MALAGVELGQLWRRANGKELLADRVAAEVGGCPLQGRQCLGMAIEIVIEIRDALLSQRRQEAADSGEVLAPEDEIGMVQQGLAALVVFDQVETVGDNQRAGVEQRLLPVIGLWRPGRQVKIQQQWRTVAAIDIQPDVGRQGVMQRVIDCGLRRQERTAVEMLWR